MGLLGIPVDGLVTPVVLFIDMPVVVIRLVKNVVRVDGSLEVIFVFAVIIVVFSVVGVHDV